MTMNMVFGDPTIRTGFSAQVHSQLLDVRLIVQVSAILRHVNVQSRRQRHSILGNYHLGLSQDFHDVDVILALM